ncbi:substrate-binding domain-containing protein [Bacterioplanes sanyensis]|nr:substrate-binding domain-containing protein [Bacterioplanes sanyensis]
MARFACCAVLWLSLGLLGCDQQDEAEVVSPTVDERAKVLLVMKSLVNPFYAAMEKGARQAAEIRAAQLIVRSGTNETLVEQQIEIIDEHLASGIDALVIAPANSVEIIPVLLRAHQQGVKVVNIDNQVDPMAAAAAGLPPIPFVSVDNERGGFLAAKYLASLVDGEAKALVIEGPRSAKNAIQRRNGALAAFEQAGNIELVAAEPAHWKLEQAYALTKQMHAKYPDINLVFAANDMMALGAILYAQENELSDWLIGGYDNIPDAASAVKSGWLKVTVDQQADQQGYRGVMTALDLLESTSVDPTVLVDVLVVTD